MLRPTLYQATGQVLLNDPRSSGGAAADFGLYINSGRYVRNQAEVFESPQVATRASEILEGAISPLEIQDATTATALSDVDALEIRGTQPSSSGSVGLVDAVVEAYGEVVAEGISSEVEDTIATLEESKLDVSVTIAEMDSSLAIDPENAAAEAQRNAALAQLVTINTRIEQLSTNAALYGSGIQLYVPPTIPTSPIQPKPVRNAGVAFVVGLATAGAWAWWRGERDQRADDRNAPARILDAPLLAAIPEYGDADAVAPNPTVTSPASGAAEAYHFAVSSLGFALDQIGGTTVLVTSVAPSDGKSVTALNVAIAAAQDGRRALLLDADERARGLTRLAGRVGQAGITDVGNGTPVEEVVNDWTMADETALPFVSAGSDLHGSTAGYFRSAVFREALPTLADSRDLVIIDSPPVMSAAETADLAAQADGVVVVVRHGTPLRDLDDAGQRLAMSGTPILGYVYNRARGKSHGYGYGYGYGYGDDTN